MPAEEHLILVGASVRAAAFSALRAGLRPWCVDLFADRDLRARCPARAISGKEYPDGFLALLGDAPPGPVLYTGALENRPALIERLAEARTVWGNSATVLRQVRSPARLREVLLIHELPCPRIVAAGEPPPREGRWLLKPLRGAGGAGIRKWNAESRHERPDSYLQEFLEGESYSATYLGDGERARLLGVTRQLVGEAWLHAAPFHYCGSVGPVALSAGEQQSYARLGDALVSAFGLRGLFGVDCIARAGIPHPVEVNPRYTASVEVLEYSTGIAAMALHAGVFSSASGGACPRRVGGSRTTHTAGTSPAARGVVGKAIWFAPRDLIFPANGPWESPSRDDVPRFADIPDPGQQVPAGRPILSYFVQAANGPTCEARLQQVAAELDSLLG